VRGAIGRDGASFGPGSGEPLIGGTVESTNASFPDQSPSGRYYAYTAKMVDSDPDQQLVSQIWGLQVRVATPNGASVVGKMTVTSMTDAWLKCHNLPGKARGGAIYQSVLTDLTWTDTSASPLLEQLQAASEALLSIKFALDGYDADTKRGRITGAIGPASIDEPIRFVAGRRLVARDRTFGPTPARVDARRGRLILDMANTVPTAHVDGHPPFSLSPVYPEMVVGVQLRHPLPVALKEGVEPHGGTTAPALPSMPAGTVALGKVDCSQQQYEESAGIVELSLDADQLALIADQPLVLFVPTPANTVLQAAAEDPSGICVQVGDPVLRMDPGDPPSSTYLLATRWGAPLQGLELELKLVPSPFQAWNNIPASALAFDPAVTTDSHGRAVVSLTATDPSAQKPIQRRHVDGQLYFLGGDWQAYGQVGPMGGGAISVLVWDACESRERPTWEDVQPIFAFYARMCPYMRGLLDISDHETIVQKGAGNVARMIEVLAFVPEEDPHSMPVLRDLSAAKRRMLIRWLESRLPQE
jgi:hypothetical protein